MKWLIGLTQRRISSTASGSSSGCARSFSHSLAVLAEREQPAADRVARRLVAGLDEQLAVRRRAARSVSGAPSIAAADQLAHEIVAAGRAGARSISRSKYACSSPRARLIVWPGRLARSAVLGVVLADHLVGPAEQQLPVVARHAEDPGDHRERERRRDALDEVELARRRPSAPRRRGSRPRCARRRRWRARTALRREARVRDAAHRPVLRRVEHHDHLRRRHRRRAARASVIPCALENRSGCAAISQDVGVLRDRPERLVAGRLDVRDRRLGAQPRPHLVRIPAARVALGIDEVERIDVDVTRHLRLPRQAEEALADDVALDLARAAHDRVGARRQQTARPPPAVDRAVVVGHEQRVRAEHRDRGLVRAAGSCPAQNSFTRLDSAPISSPRASRASVRALCRRKISTSIHDRASRWRTSGSSCAPAARARLRPARRSPASCSTCSFQMNDAPRSLASVVFATRQPSCSGPMRFSTGTSTSSRNTSLNSLLAGHLAQRAHVDARRVHRDREHRDALVRRRVGVGAHERDAHVGEASRTTTTPSGRSRR